MSMFYSAKARGFFHPAIHDTMPPDAVEITDEHHAELLDGQAKGGRIEPGTDGAPVLVPLVATLADAQAMQCSQIDAAADAVYSAQGLGSPGRAAEFARANATAWDQLVTAVGTIRTNGKAKVMAAKNERTAEAATDAAIRDLHALIPPG